MDGYAHIQNRHTDGHQFQKKPSPGDIQSCFKLIGQSVFELESGNQNISNERTPNTGKWRDPNFESNQALVVSYHPVKLLTFKLIGQSVFELESRNIISRWRSC